MSIRIKLTNKLIKKINDWDKKTSLDNHDILTVINEAFPEKMNDYSPEIESLHNLVKNGANYYVRRGNLDNPIHAETSIVDMDNTLYLLTDRLQELELILTDGGQRISCNYRLKDKNWD